VKLPGSRRDLVAIGFLTIALTVVFSDVLFFGQAFYFRDLTRFYYPGKKLVRETVLAGDFPSWNRYYAGGQPLAANPEYEVFYPPQWLIFLPDFDLGYRLHILIHFYLAAFGMYALLRDGSLRIESALFGSIVFVFGGLFLSSVNLLPILFALTWIPWIALFARRWLAEGRVSDGVFAALALGLQCLASEPSTMLLTGLLLTGYALAMPSRLRRLMRLVPLYTGALALAAVQIIPAIDLARDSVRARPFPFATVATWSTPPLKFIELLLPSFLGPVDQHALFYWGTAQYGWRDPFYLSIYFGLLPLALVVGGLRAKITGWRIVATAALVSALLAVGSHTPLLRALYEMRVFSSLRYPEKFVALGLVPLMIFGAVAFDRLLDGEGRILRTAIFTNAMVAALALALLLVSLTPGYASRFIDFWGIGIHPLAETMARLSVRTWLYDFLRAAVVLGLLLAASRADLRKWSWLAILVLTFDLAIERLAVAESIDGTLFTPPPAARLVAGDSSRLFHQADWYGAAVVARRYFDLPDAPWVYRNGLFPNYGVAWGVHTVMDRDIDATNLLPATDFVEAMWQVKARGRKDWIETFAAMSNAEVRAVYRPFDEAVARAGDDLRKIEPIGFLPLPKSPRYAFADQLVGCRDVRQFVELLTAKHATQPPTQLTTQWSHRVAFIDAPLFAPAPGQVLAVRERSNEVTLNVRAAGPAFLVCSITRHRYWQATIDGVPAPLVPTNVAWQGLRIAAGTHVVRLVYRNPLIAPCSIVSIASLLLLIALAAYDLHRDRSER
jgi:hypothetical protein